MKARIPVLALAIVVLVLAAAMLSAGALADTRRPTVLPPNAHPYGQSYGEWAADWWQWALSQPVSTNPLLDETGARCANGQAGRVWFLAGAFASGSVNRSCTVPTGTALFFPVVNVFYCAFTTDPPEQRTEEFVRSQVSFVEDSASGLSATIDGVAVPDIKARYFEESALFSVVLPADNLFALPEGFVLDPCVDAGYYLMVAPLSRGEHTIHFAGSLDSFSLDVTYQLTVA